MENKSGRILITGIVIAICAWFMFPTVSWYAFTPAHEKALAMGTKADIKKYSQGQASRILRDLLDSDPSQKLGGEYSFIVGLINDEGQAKLKDPTVGEVLASAGQKQILDLVEGYFREKYQKLKKLSQNALSLGLDLKGGMSILLDADVEAFSKKLGSSASASQIDNAILEDIEVLKKRIDQYGVAEPEIRRQGDSQILIEIPGEADPQKVDTFLRGKGALCFQLVDWNLTSQARSYYEKNPSLLYSDNGAMIQPDWLADGYTLTGIYTTDAYGMDVLTDLIVIDSDIALDGRYILEAQRATEGVNNKPAVTFTLSSEGGDLFYEFTKSHLKETLAVVMDGNVKAYASIGSAISSNVQMTGFTVEEADQIAILLKTASLPIEVEVASQQAVGASLGEDAVRIGLKAVGLGIVLVVLFMFAYYGVSGLVADLAIILNLLMLVSLLTGLKFTLTLTGLAGLVLTVGMAVDSNVIIFERMKEEAVQGLGAKGIVSAGYSKALWTILDANITTMIAGIVLILFGSASVKGFAVTLVLGIISSLFSSLFFTHLIFDLCVKRRLLLGWRVYNG